MAYSFSQCSHLFWAMPTKERLIWSGISMNLIFFISILSGDNESYHNALLWELNSIIVLPLSVKTKIILHIKRCEERKCDLIMSITRVDCNEISYLVLTVPWLPENPFTLQGSQLFFALASFVNGVSYIFKGIFDTQLSLSTQHLKP